MRKVSETAQVTATDYRSVATLFQLCVAVACCTGTQIGRHRVFFAQRLLFTSLHTTFYIRPSAGSWVRNGAHLEISCWRGSEALICLLR